MSGDQHTILYLMTDLTTELYIDKIIHDVSF